MTSAEDYISNIPIQRDSIVLKQTTPLEIDNIIRKLPNKNSSGHDEVSNIMLKALQSTITFPLCHIFNHSIIEGSFPEHMKWAEVIPLYKGISMDEMVNYRPISLLLILSKILEKVIYIRLYSYLENKGTLYGSQYGFQSKRSCEQAIMGLMGYVLQSKNQNGYSVSVYLDLSKAFNTLDHKILLNKLDRYGIQGIAHKWLKNYLKDRSLIAKVTTTPYHVVKLDNFKITFGTAQGSCLGPLLFTIFVNDIHLLPLYSKIVLYTDDTTIFNSHKST